MSIFTSLLVFVIIWWVVWFMALPIGVRTPEKVEPGHTASAPEKPKLWVKAAIVTPIALALSALVIYLIESGALSLGEP